MIQMQTSIQILMFSLGDILHTAFTYKHTHKWIHKYFCSVILLMLEFMPYPQAESILAAGQNKPATEPTDPLDASKEDKETDHYALSVHLP